MVHVFARWSGANANTEILHRGTGSLRLKAQDAGYVAFNTNNIDRVRITSGGTVGVDTVGNTITMSKNAQTSETFTASSPAIIPQGAVDTASGFLLDITSENDFGISTDRTVIPMGTGAQFGVIGVGVRKLSDTYNYPLTRSYTR